MIPAKRKVGHDLFDILIKQGKSYHSPSFSLRTLNSGEPKPAQFSVVVSKKIDPKAKNAVWRNSLKRRVYNILRPILKTATPGGINAFFLKKGSDTVSITALRAEVDLVLKKANIIR